MSFEAALQVWHDFYVATAGAAAALLGLLFVGVSISLGSLDVAHRVEVRSRANQAFVNLTFVLVLALTALIPGQDAASLAITCGVLAALGVVGVVRRLLVLARSRSTARVQARTFRHLFWALLAVAFLGFATYEFRVAGTAGTLYDLVAVIFLLLLGAADVSWDLLITVGDGVGEDARGAPR